MKHKKIMALILAAAMVAGSSMAVLADGTDPATSADSEGTSYDHVNKEITAVTLPTQDAVATVFNYYVDPEGVIGAAGQLPDGTELAENADGVYFTNAGTAAVQGTVSSSIAADSDSDYEVSVSDLNTNQKYTYNSGHWENEAGDDVTGTVTIEVKQAGGVTDGTVADGDTVTVSGAVAAVAASYSSSSDAVKFEGKNSVAVDVTVTAAVTATTAATDITLVADQAALDAAEGPALLMTLKVGNDSKVITSAGATATATIAGVPGNFEVKPNSGQNGYVFGLKDDDELSAWNSTTVQLTGKTNAANIDADDGMTVPKITLTWTVAKSAAPAYTDGGTARGVWGSDGLYWVSKDANTGFSSESVTVELSDDGITYKTMATNLYNYAGGWISMSWDNIVTGFGSEPSSLYVRVIDGTTRYVVGDE